MAYPLPQYSKSKVKQAGLIFKNLNPKNEDTEWAYDILNNWRVCHGYPLNTFNVALRKRVQVLKFQNATVAQRLKRAPTMIEKLRRFKTMQLSTMQDIGGLRAILQTLDDVSTLEQNYLTDKRLTHELKSSDDYIEHPKEDGYRSIHLIYKYNNKRAQKYYGLLIELQIRTRLQHEWATAVETMGTFLGQSLKSGKGETKWRDFFALASSAFAHIEKAPPIPKYSKLDKKQTFEALAHIERDIDARNIMAGHKFALKLIQNKKGKSFYYHLILLDSINHTVNVTSYAKRDIKKASEDYIKTEKEIAGGKKVEAVLVSAGDIRSLKKAYPNFFLDVEAFIRKISTIVDKVNRISSYANI